jgi:hypothetical protein
MKKYPLFFIILFIFLWFIIVFPLGFEQQKKQFVEIKDIHKSAELVIQNYLHDSTIFPNFISSPIYHDKNGCVIVCYVESKDSFSTKHRTRFDILLQRENKVWKAMIIKTDKDLPITKVMKKPAPWEFFIKSERKGR